MSRKILGYAYEFLLAPFAILWILNSTKIPPPTASASSGSFELMVGST
jgi:hypothetical protein